MRRNAGLIAVVLAACGGQEGGPLADEVNADAARNAEAGTSADAERVGDGPATMDGGEGIDAWVTADATAPGAGCTTISDQLVSVAHAGASDEHALEVKASAGSATRWSEAGNEAVVLEVHTDRGLVGHLVLHQGQSAFTYSMHVGELAAGEAVRIQVSPLTAPRAALTACVTVTLTAATDLGAAGDGLRRAPIFRWPVAKRFDDLPVLVGWSRATASFQAVYSHENGGTVASCGGGARGMEAEIARWGRGFDIEGVYTYGGTPTWGRCTGTATASAGAPRLEAAHPIFYYGDGHNRLFEHRGGYGRVCGSRGPERADGDLTGWNVDNPGNEESRDGASVITLRPLPVDLDALGFATYRGRREGLVDRYAPWIYRLTWLELEREDRIDGNHTWPLDHYLFADVRAADVDGSGDGVCTPSVRRGFVLRVVTRDGQTLSGPQMTASYFGADHDWKRIAIPLPRAYAPADLIELVFDAYDDDGIYLLALGDAFVVTPAGDNEATLAYLHRGELAVGVYVDDDRSSCTGGVNRDGPDGLPAVCMGSEHRFTP